MSQEYGGWGLCGTGTQKCLWEARRLLSETVAGRANQRPRDAAGCVGLPENGVELSMQDVLHVASPFGFLDLARISFS